VSRLPAVLRLAIVGALVVAGVSLGRSIYQRMRLRRLTPSLSEHSKNSAESLEPANTLPQSDDAHAEPPRAVTAPEGTRTQTEPPGDSVTATNGEHGHAAAARPKRRWRDRRTVRNVRREAVRGHATWADRDEQDNETSRLPMDDAVHLGGLVLVEAFTPSTVSALYQALMDLPARQPSQKDEWIATLTRSRSATSGSGWGSLVTARPPGEFVVDGFHDSTLPKGVDAVWLQLHYPTPSLTMVAATFTFDEDAGDLSPLLRTNYRTEFSDVHLRIPGRLGRMRAKIPWARPSNYSVWKNIRGVTEQKALACELFVREREEACWRWLTARFRGRFSIERFDNRPCTRLLLTKAQRPFEGRSNSLEPVGLGSGPVVWRSTEGSGWSFKINGWRQHERRFAAIAAARRADAASDLRQEADSATSWSLTQLFHSDQSPLVVRWTMTCLLSLYVDRLGELRDRAGVRRRMGRPVRQAREFDKYLMGDGLDASTVASDLRTFAENLQRFRWSVPEYSEDRDEYPEPIRSRAAPAELVPTLCTSLSSQAARLLGDMSTTTTNLSASAALRQAIANTRLQRAVLTATVIATLIALTGLWLTLGELSV